MKIVIPGVPVSQARMRYSGNGKFVRVYDPRANVKKQIKEEIWKQVGKSKRLKNPVATFIFHMPIPKGLRKSERLEAESGLKKHIKKPDVDNLVKLYLDCMTEIAFDGDEEIFLGPAVKLYHVEPKTIIMLHETGDSLSPLEVDLLTAFALLGEECGKQSLQKTESSFDLRSPEMSLRGLSLYTSFLRHSTESCEKALLAHDLPELAYLASALPSRPFALSGSGYPCQGGNHTGCDS